MHVEVCVRVYVRARASCVVDVRDFLKKEVLVFLYA